MSLYDYNKSKEISIRDYPFYALIMAAFRQADSKNLVVLAEAFPQIYREFWARYDAPGGMLEAE